MLQTNKFALKEWAVVVHALRTGRQLIILRKGGLEEEDPFRIEHSDFFLYPTFEHQNRKFVRPEFLADFDNAINDQSASRDLVISGYAAVIELWVATDLDRLRTLSPFHIWNDDCLKMRLNYKPERPLHVLLLQVSKIPPVRVPFRPEYRGCKSWVELDMELSTMGGGPVLTDAEFEVQRQRITQTFRSPLERDLRANLVCP